MKKIILCLLCAIFPLVSIFSQSNFKEGYIIKNNQDTVNGWIDFRTNHINSLVCKFKQSETGPEKIYQPGEIKSYRFINEGKYYVTKTVVIDSVKQTFFLEYLVQGMMNLYYLPQEKSYYFFEDKDGSLLSITKKPDEIIDSYNLKVDNRYKGMLSYIFRDCLPLSVETAKANFNKETMIVLTKNYHDQMCESGEKCIIFENDYKKKFTKFNFTVFSGMEFNNTALTYAGNTYMLSSSPIVGVGINVSSPRLTKALSIMVDATLSKIGGSGDFDNGYMAYSHYSFSGLKSNLYGGLEYVYHKGKIRPAINVGFSYNSFYNLKSTLKSYYYTFENKPLIKDSSSGIKTGIGIDYQIKNDQFIVLRFLYAGHSNYLDNINTYQLKLGYKF